MLRLLSFVVTVGCAHRQADVQDPFADLPVIAPVAEAPEQVPTVIETIGADRARLLWLLVSSDRQSFPLSSSLQNNTFKTFLQHDGTLLIEYDRIDLWPKTLQASAATRMAITVDDQWRIIEVRVGKGLIHGDTVTWPASSLRACATDDCACVTSAERQLAQFAKVAVVSRAWYAKNKSVP